MRSPLSSPLFPSFLWRHKHHHFNKEISNKYLLGPTISKCFGKEYTRETTSVLTSQVNNVCDSPAERNTKAQRKVPRTQFTSKEREPGGARRLTQRCAAAKWPNQNSTLVFWCQVQCPCPKWGWICRNIHPAWGMSKERMRQCMIWIKRFYCILKKIIGAPLVAWW